MNTHSQINGTVTGAQNIVLRAEGALVFAAATFAFSQIHSGWLLYAILFFTPDIFMLGYLANARLGSIIYNIGHSYLVPAVLLGLGWFTVSPFVSAIALIWIAHIGFDRAVGYGLKYAAGFKINHLSAPTL